MEPTEPIITQIPPGPPTEIILGAEAKYFLHTAGRWASFLGILGFIGTGFVVLAALFISTIFTALSHLNPATAALGNVGTGAITFVYLLIAVFYFFMSYYLYQFGVKIKASTSFNDSALATKAFEYLKSHLKLIGITAIVIISLYLLIIIGVIVAVIAAASMR